MSYELKYLKYKNKYLELCSILKQNKTFIYENEMNGAGFDKKKHIFAKRNSDKTCILNSQDYINLEIEKKFDLLKSKYFSEQISKYLSQFKFDINHALCMMEDKISEYYKSGNKKDPNNDDFHKWSYQIYKDLLIQRLKQEYMPNWESTHPNINEQPLEVLQQWFNNRYNNYYI